MFFGKIIDRLNPNKSFEHFYPQLQNIIEKVVSHTQDFESLLAMVIYLLSITTYNFDFLFFNLNII